MANFKVELEFIDLKNGPAPRKQDLLFFNFDARHGHQAQHYARGWVDEQGHPVLIGGQWKPTHYALVPDFYAAGEAAEKAAAAAGGGGEQNEATHEE